MARTIFANLPDGLNPLKLLDTTFADCASLATNNVFSGTNQFGTGYAARLLNVGSGFVAAQPYMVNFGDNQAPAGSRAIFFGFDDFTRPANGLWYNMAIHNVANGGFAIPAGGTLGVWASVVDIGIDNTPAPANISYGHWFKHTVAKGTGAGGGAVLIQAFGAVGFTPSALGTANSGVLGLQCNAWSDVGGYSFAGVFGVITTVSGSQNVGIEVDNDIRANTAGDQIGIQVISQNGSGVGTPTVAGANIGYYLAKSTGPGYNNAIQLGAANGTGFPLLSTGAILKAFSSSTIATGIDISSLTITGNAFASKSFTVVGGTGRVGVGTETNPQNPLVISSNVTTGIQGSSTLANVVVIGADSAAAMGMELAGFSSVPNFTFSNSGGSAATPAAVGAGVTLGRFGGRGVKSTGPTAYSNSNAQINFVTAEAFTPTNLGTLITFLTCAIAGTVAAESMRIQPSGGVSVGTIVDPGKGGVIACLNAGTPTTFSSGVQVTGVDGASVGFNADVIGGTANNNFRRANGTLAGGLTKLVLGNPIGAFNAIGYDATGVYSTNQARISMLTTEDWNSATNRGTAMNFQVTPAGSGTIATVMTITGVSGVNQVGVGTEINPQSQFVVSKNVTTGIVASTSGITMQLIGADAANAGIEADSYGNACAFGGRRAGGTAALSTGTETGSDIVRFQAFGYDGSGFTAFRGRLAFTASETWAGTANGVYANIFTTPTGSNVTTTSTRFQPSGGVSIGSTAVSTDPGLGNLLVQNFINTGGYVRQPGDLAISSNTTPQPALTVTVVAGNTYGFDAYLPFTDAAAGGVQCTVNGSCTSTAFVCDGYLLDSNTVKAMGHATVLGGALVSTTTTATSGLVVRIHGTITVNAGGTFGVFFAQNTSNGTATTLKAGAWCNFWLIT